MSSKVNLQRIIEREHLHLGLTSLSVGIIIENIPRIINKKFGELNEKIYKKLE